MREAEVERILTPACCGAGDLSHCARGASGLLRQYDAGEERDGVSGLGDGGRVEEGEGKDTEAGGVLQCGSSKLFDLCWGRVGRNASLGSRSPSEFSEIVGSPYHKTKSTDGANARAVPRLIL